MVSALADPVLPVPLLNLYSVCAHAACGVAPQSVVPLIAHGSVAKVGDYPWFAGIFRSDDKWESICGGTLVRPDVVVSGQRLSSSSIRRRIDKFLT